MENQLEDEFMEMTPVSDYYITYHYLLRARAILEDSIDLLNSNAGVIESNIEIDQELFERIFEAKRCLESINFKHDVLNEPVRSK